MGHRTEHIDKETLAAYAVDGLTPDEVAGIGRHLATCDVCQNELASLQAVASFLPYALAPAEPPPDLRNRVLERVLASRPGQPVAPSAPLTSRSARRRWSGWRSLGLAAAMLVVGLLLGRIWPAGRSADLVDHPDARAATLTGQGSGTFVVAPTARQVRLLVSGLPPLGTTEVYQLWLLGGTSPVSVGTFTVDATGRGVLELRGLAWSPGYQGVAITAEPLGGSAGPTSDILLKADF